MAGKTREIREGENKNKMILYNLSRLMTSIAILIIVEEFYKALFKKK